MVTELYDTNLAGPQGRLINTVVFTMALENGRFGLQDAKAVQNRDRRTMVVRVWKDFMVSLTIRLNEAISKFARNRRA
ncbi:hypothetical protein BWQ96_07010 [Gracilariopsis chorda]|uniref:Uncharacterized protein n=1 Tax=Gracilariopsis chorda TaxID=448386 RepID=A0A2V3IMF8_9FLOR|nr:hypothetical protein BWQ96_07010 [Gracilariopsis chorda]|eukprot:PXF43237.1 hypothetical protein BWQ96_07010 [Gracilariopsis chorda]